ALRRVPGGGIGEQLQDRQRGNGFPRAALADKRQGLTAVEREGGALHRLDLRRAAPAAEGHAEIADFEQAHRLSDRGRIWRARRPRSMDAHAHRAILRGSKASRTASPIKIRRLSMTASTTKAVMPSHGACKLALPCANNSPSEA